ncbi:MAG: nuclear transport factor 2 family protein [Pseudomonadota bacterium]
MTSNFDAVHDVLGIYLDGLYHSDTERLGRAFHPDARYVCATGGELINLGMDEYFPIVDARPAPASCREERQDEIVSIEFAGPKTAFARLYCAIGEKYFTDLLTLVFDDNQWRIIAKVFHFDVIPKHPANC